MILRIVGIMALGMSLAVSAHAGRGIDRARGQALWDAAVNGKTTTIGGGNGSMQVIRPTTTGTPVRGSGGGVTVTDTMPVPVGGVNVPVSATTNVSKADIAGAVVGCATGGVVGCALSSIPLAIAYMSLSGARVSPSNPQQLELYDTKVCTVAPCYAYQVVGSPAFNGMPTYRSMSAVAQAALELFNAWPSRDATLTECHPEVENDRVVCSTAETPNRFRFPLSRADAPPQSPTWYPATPQEVKDALYNNDPPPAIIDELSKYGNIIWPGPSAVTGPSSVTGPKVTSNSTSGNQSSQTISQTSTPMTYQGASVTAGNPTTSSTTTTTTTNPDGSTSTSTSSTTSTTEQGSAPETRPEEAAPTDTALPPVPNLYARKYPNGMEGIWGDYKDRLKGTSLVSLVDKLMPNVGSGGSCPSWMLNLDLDQWARFGTHDVAPPCWIWDVAKAILILSALLLARSLIFGG